MVPSQFSDKSPGRLVPVQMKWSKSGSPLDSLLGSPLGTTMESLSLPTVRLETVETWAYVPNPLPPDLNWAEVQHRLQRKIRHTVLALGEVNGLYKRGTVARDSLRSLWIREAKSSSAVEDIHTTAEDMVFAGMARKQVEGRSAASQAWKYVETLEYGVASDLPTSRRLMLEMHRVLLTGVPREPGESDPRPGEFRDIHVMIGAQGGDPRQARFIPPPPGAIFDECLNAFEQFANSEENEIDPLVALAMRHYQFEAIHPFRDGNGRIGRVLVARDLVKSGLLEAPVVYLSAHIKRHKSTYNDLLLGVSLRNEWEAFVEFMLDAILTQAREAGIRAARLLDLRERYLRELVAASAPARLNGLVNRLFKIPVINAAEAEVELGVQKAQVYKDIAMLERVGVLTEVTGRKKDRDWSAREILHLIDTDEL